MGQRMIQAFLWGIVQQPSTHESNNWAGDRFTLLEGPQGERALAALILYDGPVNAEDFHHEVATGFAEGRDEVYVGLNENRALLLIGPSESITAKMKAQFPDF